MVYYRFIDDSSNKRQIQHNSGIELLKEGLHKEYGFDITENDIFTADKGKPYLREMCDCFFSISHCDGLCCCIVSPCECGIDCENIRDYRPNVIKRILTDKERKWFDCLDKNIKSRFFFILWTLKEAYGKFTGNGIADMKNVSFNFENGILQSDKEHLDFFVYELDGYILSICIKKGQSHDCSFGNRIY